MGWVECIGEAISYIEDNITDKMLIDKTGICLSEIVCISYAETDLEYRHGSIF